EARLDPPRKLLRIHPPETDGQLAGRQPTRQFQQRQGIATRLGDDPVPDPLVQHESHRRSQQRARIAVDEAANLHLGQGTERLTPPPGTGPGPPPPPAPPHTRPPPAPQKGTEPQTPTSPPTPDRATAHHRSRTAADVAPPPRRTNSAPRGRQGSDRAGSRR